MEEMKVHSGKIAFALLVHNKRDVILDLLDNIKFYCPDSSVFLYNGGDDPKLCKGLDTPVCPTSRKLQYGVTAIYLLETMKWLEDMAYEYDYLINIDSDVLFAREGFEPFIREQMKDKDYMGVETKLPDEDYYCGIQVRKEIDLWMPLFGMKPFYESFNVGQVFRRSLVQSFLEKNHYDVLAENLKKTKAFGIDEIAFVTMADRYGFKLHAYPQETGSAIRYRPHYRLEETLSWLNKRKTCYMFHPITREMMDETRVFIRSTLKQQIQYDPEVEKRFLDSCIGEMPLYIRRAKSTGRTVEWLAASLKEGMSYWRSSQRNNKKYMYGPYDFGSSRVEAFTVLESQYRNLEAVCRIGDKLVHYWRDEDSGEWFESQAFAEGVRGTPGFIESSYGNFEVVVPLEKGGLGHWYRNNRDPDLPWLGPEEFGQDIYNKVILIQNNMNQLHIVVKTNHGYEYYVRDDGASWLWLGPYN